jgi:hypothetical protein
VRRSISSGWSNEAQSELEGRAVTDSPFIGLRELAERYGVEERLARKVADEVGFIRIGRKVLLRRDWVEGWEAAQRTAPTSPTGEVSPRRRRRPAGASWDLADLPPGYWREGDS